MKNKKKQNTCSISSVHLRKHSTAVTTPRSHSIPRQRQEYRKNSNQAIYNFLACPVSSVTITDEFLSQGDFAYRGVRHDARMYIIDQARVPHRCSRAHPSVRRGANFSPKICTPRRLREWRLLCYPFWPDLSWRLSGLLAARCKCSLDWGISSFPGDARVICAPVCLFMMGWVHLWHLKMGTGGCGVRNDLYEKVTVRCMRRIKNFLRWVERCLRAGQYCASIRIAKRG